MLASTATSVITQPAAAAEECSQRQGIGTNAVRIRVDNIDAAER
jgi:hypothetical protein